MGANSQVRSEPDGSEGLQPEDEVHPSNLAPGTFGTSSTSSSVDDRGVGLSEDLQDRCCKTEVGRWDEVSRWILGPNGC